MNSQLFATLEKAINEWGGGISETEEYEELDGYWPEQLSRRMTEAAAAVFDANFEAQDYLEQHG